jgi:alpha-beta hydrolase superfamily lysophospholipase
MLAALLGLVLSGAAAAQPTDACRTRGQAALAAWTQGRDGQVGKDFAPTIAAKLTPALLRQVWGQLQAQAGTFESLGTLAPRPLDGRDALVAPLAFSGTPLAAIVHCDGQDRIDGFRVVPAASVKATVAAPEPAIPGAVSRPLPVPSPLGPLPGTLTLPEGEGPFPAVVLVAGSGAHDQDETIGPNKPFRDLAAGLAAHGVASLRYDKRTYVHATRMAGQAITVDDEVTDDALAAAHLLARQPGIDPHRLFVLGHSLGAMMAPRIGRRDPQLAGLVLLAAPARALLDVSAGQVREQGRRHHRGAAQIAASEQAIAAERKLLAGADPRHPPTGSFGNLPQGYWLSLHDYRQVDVAKGLALPMLILQGDADFQVSPTLDFARWEQALAGRPQTAFHLYPGLGHLFMPAGKTGTVADYAVPGHVDARVIDDIAAWIEAQPAHTASAAGGS